MNLQISNKKRLELWLTFVHVLLAASMFALMFSIYHAFTYSWPLSQGDYLQASQSILANRAQLFHDAALISYKEEDYGEALVLLGMASEELHDASGVPAQNKLDLAAELKFVTGNIQVKMGQLELAKQFYREALRLNPNHRHAKYNLELLEKPQLAGNGKGQGEGDAAGGEEDSQDPNSKNGSPSPPKQGI